MSISPTQSLRKKTILRAPRAKRDALSGGQRMPRRRPSRCADCRLKSCLAGCRRLLAIRSESDPAPLMQELAAGYAAGAAGDSGARFSAWVRRWLRRQIAAGPLAFSSRRLMLPKLFLNRIGSAGAFRPMGHRIGYGAGHYDRTLARLRDSKKIIAIGLAFAVQEIETIPRCHTTWRWIMCYGNAAIRFRSRNLRILFVGDWSASRPHRHSEHLPA